jgi:hypothetical protein
MPTILIVVARPVVHCDRTTLHRLAAGLKFPSCISQPPLQIPPPRRSRFVEDVVRKSAGVQLVFGLGGLPDQGGQHQIQQAAKFTVFLAPIPESFEFCLIHSFVLHGLIRLTALGEKGGTSESAARSGYGYAWLRDFSRSFHRNFLLETLASYP